MGPLATIALVLYILPVLVGLFMALSPYWPGGIAGVAIAVLWPLTVVAYFIYTIWEFYQDES